MTKVYSSFIDGECTTMDVHAFRPGALCTSRGPRESAGVYCVGNTADAPFVKTAILSPGVSDPVWVCRTNSPCGKWWMAWGLLVDTTPAGCRSPPPADATPPVLPRTHERQTETDSSFSLELVPICSVSSLSGVRCSRQSSRVQCIMQRHIEGPSLTDVDLEWAQALQRAHRNPIAVISGSLYSAWWCFPMGATDSATDIRACVEDVGKTAACWAPLFTSRTWDACTPCRRSPRQHPVKERWWCPLLPACSLFHGWRGERTDPSEDDDVTIQQMNVVPFTRRPTRSSLFTSARRSLCESQSRSNIAAAAMGHIESSHTYRRDKSTDPIGELFLPQLGITVYYLYVCLLINEIDPMPRAGKGEGATAVTKTRKRKKKKKKDPEEEERGEEEGAGEEEENGRKE